MKIGLDVLGRQIAPWQEEYEAAAIRVIRSGRYILGAELSAFEEEFARFTGRKYCVGVNSGLDALTLSVRALGIGAGDEVIVPANTYIATAIAVTENGARPVFVEPDDYYVLDADRIEALITKRTRAIMAVHLYGQAAEMEKISHIAKEHGLFLIEDCAQSHGATFFGKMTGTFGEAGCFSFYPTKNLGAFGDSGAVVTDDENLFKKLRMLRNYGSEVKYQNELEGVNSRLDEIQASLLRVKLSHLDELTKERQEIAKRFLADIKNPAVTLPKTRRGASHVWHQFVVRTARRDDFQAYLKRFGIDALIHYPVPPHLAKCYGRLGYARGDFPLAEKYADEVLSLPIFNGMTDEEMRYVTDSVNGYRG